MDLVTRISLIITLILTFTNFSPYYAEATETIKVAAIFSITGKAALDNAMALNGIRFAVEELNQQGGVLGKQLELLEFDNKSTALGSRIAAKKAVKAGVVTVFGANWSSHSLAMAPIFQAAGIPMISPYSTNPQVTLVGDYIFRICYIDPFQGRIMASFAIQDLNARSAGVLVNANSTFSEGLADYFIRSYRQLGGKILFVANYLDKTADFRPLLDQIKQYQPDVIFLPGHSKDSGLIIKQARTNSIETTFIGADGWNDSMYKIMGSVVEGSYYSNHWHHEISGQNNRLFVEKYRSQNREFDAGNALSEDCVFLFADAVRRAGSLNRAEIRDAIATTQNFPGITGNISFDKNGDPIKSAVILKFEKGASVFVKTVEP